MPSSSKKGCLLKKLAKNKKGKSFIPFFSKAAAQCHTKKDCMIFGKVPKVILYAVFLESTSTMESQGLGFGRVVK